MTELSNMSGVIVTGTDAEREQMCTRIYDLFLASGLRQPHSEMDFLRLQGHFKNATFVDVKKFVKKMLGSGNSCLNKVRISHLYAVLSYTIV